MPTAKEVKEEGLKTGETIRLLTQEVSFSSLFGYCLVWLRAVPTHPIIIE